MAFSIARYVETARMVQPAGDETLAVDWLPDGRTRLVVRVPAEGPGDAYVVGPRTRAKFKRAKGFARVTVLQVKPGWSPAIFGVSANALTATVFESASMRLARRAAHLFEDTETRVDEVARRLGITTRHLRRAFVDSIGIAPKELARGVRLKRAIREAAGSSDWGAIARRAGYYDQAHLIGDFRDLVGLTPNAYLARNLFIG